VWAIIVAENWTMGQYKFSLTEWNLWAETLPKICDAIGNLWAVIII